MTDSSDPVQPLQPPRFTPEERAALKEYWAFYEANADAVQAEVFAALERAPEWAPILRTMGPAERQQNNLRGMANQRAAILDENWGPYLAELQTQGAQYAKGGVKFGSWFQVIAIFRTSLRHRMLELARTDLPRASRIGDGMNALLDFAMASLGEAYLGTKEEIIREQQEAIREISTPVLQVREKLLIIPVVGVVDTHRARLLTEGLLRAIRERRAKGVVMDITGVPIVDSKVANHLAQACEAARLMGALVVLTGISPDIAQTLVTIGAQLRGVRTLGDLQGGIEEVDRFLAQGHFDDDDADSHPGVPA
jgi:anti-anti-sigma regulatory factor